MGQRKAGDTHKEMIMKNINFGLDSASSLRF
jgi:hypothetical protein